MKNKKAGFTLIELLVVVAIIGLLATLSLVALNSARQKARDAKRVADVKQIQTALELYYNDNYGYPDTVTSGSILSASSTYMNIVPTAPNPADGTCATANGYVYTKQDVRDGKNRSYTLVYCIGADTGEITAGTNTATPAGIE
jgi:prepilin-type N-terminal cleavage/methylation domain-containing protein